MSPTYRIKELTTLEDMRAQYPLVQQLNPSLTLEEYESMLPEMLQNSYRQVGVFLGDDKCVGVSGFWVNTKLYCGRYIEMDNVVIDAAHRSSGIGKMLVDWIVQKGQAEGCKVALLDVYVQNTDAHRFYCREGYTILGFHMKRPLNPV
jgi:GNAT superfamily N-acetyltransferase